jgi:CheY-like chemotaxis protein
LTQVLSNVLNNAAKYTPRAGRIQLTLARVGADAEIRVLDNGAGIPAAMLGSIFDMFVQVSGVARSAQGGLGIGLTLVKSLIERHGGQVKAFSEGIGKGAEIVVKLPLLDGAASALRTSAPAAPADISATVLIVDDNREAADSLCDLLSTMGARAVVAYSGEDSLKIVAESRPDVAILDIGMPEMDGWEVASRIRADERNAAMTLIALTGWGQSSDRDRSIQAGFDHHLMKPVRIDELLAILAPAPRAG